jgi:hypothetical protein
MFRVHTKLYICVRSLQRTEAKTCELHTSQQPHSSPDGTTRPQATETSAHQSAHQI